MLIEIKKLSVVNTGYERRFTTNKIFVNPAHIVSISDYEEAKDFLLREEQNQLCESNFSLIKISNGHKVEEIIAFGGAEEICSLFTKKRILLNE